MSEKFLIVGLGNPGKNYEGTRHNIGFAVLEALSMQAGITGKQENKFKAIVGSGRYQQKAVIVAQPLTYMNLSGEAVRALIQYYDIPLSQLLVIYDEAALPFGKIQIRPGGSDAGQKGIRSIIQQLGGQQQFARLRIGIGSPPPPMAMPDFVLSKFSAQEQNDLPRVIDAAINAVTCWLQQGVEPAMTQFNGQWFTDPPAPPPMASA